MGDGLRNNGVLMCREVVIAKEDVVRSGLQCDEMNAILWILVLSTVASVCYCQTGEQEQAVIHLEPTEIRFDTYFYA